LPSLEVRADAFIEGWSWGHTVLDGNTGIGETTDALFTSAASCLRSKGILVVIETMGTNVDEPAPPTEGLSQFYDLLVSKHGMQQQVIRTEYRFGTVEDAARIMGFFFGKGMKSAVMQRNSPIVPEWTGVWKGTIDN
jgi:hypothetical protein